MTDEIANEFTNWVDPDILAYDEKIVTDSDPIKELDFKKFFEIDWHDQAYDSIRDYWEPLLKDDDPNGRLYAKIALWNIVQLRQIGSQPDEVIPKSKVEFPTLDLVSQAGFAAILGVTSQRVHILKLKGKLPNPVFTVDGHTSVWTRKQATEFLEQRKK